MHGTQAHTKVQLSLLAMMIYEATVSTCFVLFVMYAIVYSVMRLALLCFLKHCMYMYIHFYTTYNHYE